MKKALVLGVAILLGIGLFASAQTLTGSWKSELTIGFQDVTFDVPGQTITIPGQSLAVSQGVVTIPAKTIPIVIQDKTYNITIPSQDVLVGPFTGQFHGGTYDVTGDTVTIPDQTLTLNINGTTVTVPVPGNTADVTPGSVDVDYAPAPIIIEDTTTHQTWSATVAPTFHYHEDYPCCDGCTVTVTLEAFDVDVVVGGVLVDTITVPAQDIDIDCCEPGPVTVPVRTGNDTHYSVTIPAQDLVKGTDYVCNPPSVTLPASSVDVTVDGITGTVFVPGGTYPVTGSTVTIPDQTINIPADTVTIPSQTVQLTVEGQDLTYTIPSYNVNVSGQTATLPPLVVTVAPVTATTDAKIPSLSFTSALTVNYTVGGWTFTSYTKLSDTGWSDQTFSASGALGAFSFSSLVDFDPATPAFEKWNVTVGISLGGMALGADWTLADNDLTLVLTGSGSTGIVEIGITSTFGGDDNDICDLPWSDVTIDVGFPFCCADVAAEVYFDCDGFGYAQFDAVGIALPNLPWLTLDASLKFELQQKTLTLSPNFDFGADVCFDLYYDVHYSGNLTIGDITFNGIGLTCEIGGVSFTGISYWGSGSKPGILKGTDYWEAYQIATTSEGCCGPFSFDLTAYFEDAHQNLFDIAQFDVNTSLQISDQFTAGMGLVYDVTSGLKLWKLTFEVTW